MSVTQTLGSLGSWNLELVEETPDYVLAQLGYFGHVAIVDGPVDVVAAGDGLLAGARYVGVCRARAKPGSYTRAGSGLLFWLGDEDGKGHVIESEISLTNATLAQAVATVLPPTVTIGTIHPQANPATRYTGKHLFQSRRDALGIVCDAFGAEFRVNGDFTVDVGTPAQLYDTTLPLTGKPSPIIVRRGAGSDVDMAAVGGDVETEGAVYDYSTRVLLLGQTIGTGDIPDEVFATGAADAPSVPFKDPQGNPVKTTRMISESGETSGSVAARAQLQLNRFNRETTAVKVTAADFETEGSFSVGDSTYVYDPDSGIVNPANQVLFHGQVLNPDAVRVSSMTWPLVEGQTVAWRTDTGVWIDLTPWVVWETPGTHELTVGDLPKTLTRPGGNVVQDRVDAARGDASIPKAPTGLTLATSSAVNPKGTDSAIITVSWDPVTQNTDNTALIDFDHYEVQYRPTYRAPLWLATAYTAGTTVDLPVVTALGYDIQVRTVDKAGNASAWTGPSSITSAADSTAPPAPADPVVSSVLGQARIEYIGTSSSGAAMPADTNRIEFHIGTTAAFTATAATRVNEVNPFARGVYYATVPYGAAARWVRLIAVDHNGNVSASSASVPLTASQVVSPDIFDGAIGSAKLANLAVITAKIADLAVNDAKIGSVSVGKLDAGIMTADVTISGRLATAPFGDRREMNAIGFQAFNAAEALTINLDGVSNLLTGIFQTALSGRRIRAGAAGKLGEIEFIAPDGATGFVRAYTENAGVEAIQYGLTVAGGDFLWNRINYNSDEWANYRANKQDFYFGSADGFFTVRQTSDKGVANAVSRLFIDPAQVILRDGADHTRVTIDEDETVLWDPSGSPRIWFGPTQIQLRDAANKTRIVIDATDTNLYDPSGRIMYQADSSATSYQHRFTTYDSAAGAQVGFVEIAPGDRLESSARIKLLTRAFPGGGLHGGQLRYWINADATSPRIEAWDANLFGLMPIWASAFTVPSDEAFKDEIRDLEPGALATVRAMRPRRYRMKTDPANPVVERERIGLVAQEAPAEIVVDGGEFLGIDLYAQITYQSAAIVELDDKVNDLAAVIETLRKKVA